MVGRRSTDANFWLGETLLTDSQYVLHDFLTRLTRIVSLLPMAPCAVNGDHMYYSYICTFTFVVRSLSASPFLLRASCSQITLTGRFLSASINIFRFHVSISQPGYVTV